MSVVVAATRCTAASSRGSLESAWHWPQLARTALPRVCARRAPAGQRLSRAPPGVRPPCTREPCRRATRATARSPPSPPRTRCHPQRGRCLAAQPRRTGGTVTAMCVPSACWRPLGNWRATVRARCVHIAARGLTGIARCCSSAHRTGSAWPIRAVGSRAHPRVGACRPHSLSTPARDPRLACPR
eukprot:Mycagemm_TRINITY_DN10948_c0_g1::TRINITY_DN10948_c0_g1_i1::g.382::m.382 type:complete len:185 gc:universal TRINITY_DN10948_c0_g1_i1:908-354(-)